jgi:hypothetical protein
VRRNDRLTGPPAEFAAAVRRRGLTAEVIVLQPGAATTV